MFLGCSNGRGKERGCPTGGGGGGGGRFGNNPAFWSEANKAAGSMLPKLGIAGGGDGWIGGGGTTIGAGGSENEAGRPIGCWEPGGGRGTVARRVAKS